MAKLLLRFIITFVLDNRKYMKVRILILLFLACCMGSTADAQRRSRSQTLPADTVAPIVKQYTNSLVRAKAAIDSVALLRMSSFDYNNPYDPRFARLFLPPTFYHGITQRRFSRDGYTPDDSLTQSIDDALTDLYFRRPDLIKNTETKMDKAGSVIKPERKAIKQQTDIVERVAPTTQDSKVDVIQLVVTRPNFWKTSGEMYLQFMQNYVSGNWYKGGESNYSTFGRLTLNANYNIQDANGANKFLWNNKLELQLGFQTSKSDTVHKVKPSTDVLRYTSNFGLRASKKWYYAVQLIATTQMLRGYRNNEEPVYSDIFSPLDLNVSLGMDYQVNWFKGKLKGTAHLAPFAYNLRYVGRKRLATRYGIDEGKHHKDDYGSEVNINLKWQISPTVNWQSRIYGYTSYKRAELQLENTINFKLTRYLTSTLYFYPRFDDSRTRDDHHGYWEFKEYTSFGLSYNF